MKASMTRNQVKMRMLISLAYLLLSLHAVGQGKAFKEALEETRKPGQPYHAAMAISSDYDMKIKEMNGYVSRNNLIVTKYDEYRVRGKIVCFMDFIPKSEEKQYDAEVKAGLQNYTSYLASIPKDANKLAKAEKIYQKALKDEGKNHPFQTLQSLHEASVMGHVKAKIAEARYYAQGKCGKKDKRRAQDLIDELLVTDDPQIWKETADLMSNDGKAYVAWRKGETKDVPFRYLYQYIDKDMALEKLREQALSGDAKAQKYISNLLWSGKDVPQDKREATKWAAMLCADDIDMRDRLIIAKGEGLYSEEIPLSYYMENNRNDYDEKLKNAAKDGNKEAEWAMLIRNNNPFELAKRAKSGDRRSAEVLNIFLNRTTYKAQFDSLKMENMLMLLNTKTGFDKYAADVSLLKKKLNEAKAFAKSGEKGKFDDGCISSNFAAFYGKYPQYDKEHLAGRAYVLDNFCKVTEYLGWRDDHVFYTKKGFGMTWNYEYEQMFTNGLQEGLLLAKRFTDDPDFGSFFAKAATELQKKLDLVYQLLERDRKIYAAYLGDKSEDEMIEKMGLPKYEYALEWHYKKDGKEGNCYIYFPDLDKHASIFMGYDDGKVYYTGSNCLKYTNEKDVIIASYAYLKYYKIRNVGLL